MVTTVASASAMMMSTGAGTMKDDGAAAHHGCHWRDRLRSIRPVVAALSLAISTIG